MEINKLTKDELIDLKNKIEFELNKKNKIKIKPNKGSILDLKSNDMIFSIRLHMSPHQLVAPTEFKGKVDIVDYCYVSYNDLRGDSDDFRISISHKTEALGITTTLLKKDYANEHCILSLDTNLSGYDAFYTLNPQTWREDIIRCYKEQLEKIDLNHNKKLNILEQKLNTILESESNINVYL